MQSSSTASSLGSVFKMEHLSPRVQHHLAKVYSMLALSVLTAAGGSFLHMQHLSPLLEGGVLAMLGTFATLLALLLFYPHVTSPAKGSQGRASLRRNLFFLFSFFYGLGLGALVEPILHFDGSIVLYALLGCALVFGSFTLSSLLSPRRSFLFLGGLLAAAVSVMSVFSLANWFFRSETIFNVNLYLGLVVFSAYVLFDTQMIVEKAEAGSGDVAGHALQLYVDMVALFVRLLIILTRKRADEEDRRKRR